MGTDIIKKLNLVLLAVDDWKCLYINGKAFEQGHSIDWSRVINSLVGKEILIENFEDHYLELNDDNPDLDNYGNRFPDNLEDVVEYQKLKK